MSYYLNYLFDADGLPKPFSRAPRLTVYKRELYDCAECINLCLLLRDRFPQLETTLETVVTGILKGLDQAGRFLPFPSIACGLGQCPNAPLGPGADVSKSSVLSARMKKAERKVNYGMKGVRSINSQLSTVNFTKKMCGIAGQFNFERREPVERETIVRMARSIAHRGPDDEGFFIAGPVGLGFRRLSIIDLAGGHQPMSDAEETVWIIFNGEIYNYKELRAELQSKGHQFRTNSDTEVIIHGYKEWGTDVFNHLNGMFGLAIWDVRKERSSWRVTPWASSWSITRSTMASLHLDRKSEPLSLRRCEARC